MHSILPRQSGSRRARLRRTVNWAGLATSLPRLGACQTARRGYLVRRCAGADPGREGAPGGHTAPDPRQSGGAVPPTANARTFRRKTCLHLHQNSIGSERNSFSSSGLEVATHGIHSDETRLRLRSDTPCLRSGL